MIGLLVLVVIIIGTPVALHLLVRRQLVAATIATAIHVGILFCLIPFAYLHSLNLVAEMLRDWGSPMSYDRGSAILWGFSFYVVGAFVVNASVGIPFRLYRHKKSASTMAAANVVDTVPESRRNIEQGLKAASEHLLDPMYCMDYAKANSSDLTGIHAMIRTGELSSYWHAGILFVGHRKVEPPNLSFQGARDEAARP